MPYFPDLPNRIEKCKEIDLAAYLVTYENFTVSEKSSKNTPVLKDPLNGFHYLIKKNPMRPSQYQAYITEDVLPDGSMNFGKKHISLIDYVMLRNRLSLTDAVTQIEQNTNTKPLTSSLGAAPDKSPSSGIADTSLLKPLSDISYLNTIRGLNASIIREPHILSSLRQRKFKSYINTAFPMRNMAGEIKNWCEKNAIPQPDGSLRSWESFPSASTTGLLFRTGNPGNDPSNVKYIVFSETPIDALSYYQLNHSFLADKTILVSSCGNINAQMMANFSHLLASTYQNARIICANDYDAAGFRFDFMIAAAGAGSLNLSDSIRPLIHMKQTPAGDLPQNDDSLNKSGLNSNLNHFVCSFSSTDRDKLLDYQKNVIQLSAAKHLNFSFSPIDTVAIDRNSNAYHFAFQFPYNLRSMKLLLDNYNSYFNLADKFLFDKTDRNFKDWNECLKADLLFKPSEKSIAFFSSENNPGDNKINNKLNSEVEHEKFKGQQIQPERQ